MISSLHEYLYHRACDAFDCGTEQQYEKYINEEKEIIIPLINRVREFILNAVRLIIGIKKVVKRRKKEVINRNKKSAFMNRKKRGQQNKGAASTYLARFQALFRVLGY